FALSFLSSYIITSSISLSSFFFFNDTAPTEIYTLSLHDALPICKRLQTSACPRLGEGLQDHRQPHPIQPSFLTAFAYSSLFAASSFKPGPDRAFFPVRLRGEPPDCHSIQF